MMQIINTEKLFSLEVINLCGGKRLGTVFSLDMDLCSNSPCVLCLYVDCDNGLSRILSYGKKNIYRIPWNRVECVSEDAILVKLTQSELQECLQTDSNSFGKQCRS